MSDIGAITSCHREGGEYFQCAQLEAKGHGPIAYVVETKKLDAFLRGQSAIEKAKEMIVHNIFQRKEIFDTDLVIAMKIYYKTRRPDLDESLILDLLQGKVLKNDRSIKTKYVEHGLDKNDPRTVLVISTLDNKDLVISTLLIW